MTQVVFVKTQSGADLLLPADCADAVKQWLLNAGFSVEDVVMVEEPPSHCRLPITHHDSGQLLVALTELLAGDIGFADSPR